MSAFRTNGRSKEKNFLKEDTVNYYKRVADTVIEGFPSLDEKELFLNNVFTQLAEEALPVCQCPLTSHIVEDLVSIATVSNLKTILTEFSKDWQSVVEDKCASHVLQKSLLVIPKFVREKVLTFDVEAVEAENEDDRTAEDYLVQVVLDLSAYMVENLEDSLTHVYTSHILRALLQVLGGTCVGEKVMKSRTSREGNRNLKGLKGQQISFTNFEVPALFKKKIKKICTGIFRSENINVHLTDINANPVIQILLLVLNKVDVDLCQKYLHRVIKRSRIKEGNTPGEQEHTESVKLPPVAVDNVGSYLVEQIVTLASEKVYTELFNELFKGRLLQFAIHSSANFVLQKFIKSCPQKEAFEEILDEMGEYLEDTLAVNHFGVIVALAETCHRLEYGQEKLTQLLLSSFHCLEPVERQIKLVPLLASFKTYEVFYQGPVDNQQSADQVPTLRKINYHGSLLLQQMLRFSNTKSVVTSLLDLKPVELKTMSIDACGSHVIDAFFQSSSVADNGKDAMLNKMKGLYVDIACNSNGSRTLETVWKNINVKQKSLVAEELCRQEEKVRSDRFGGYIHRNFGLRQFVNRRSDWMSTQGSDMKKRKMFKDIIETDKSSAKKHKKHKKKTVS